METTIGAHSSFSKLDALYLKEEQTENEIFDEEAIGREEVKIDSQNVNEALSEENMQHSSETLSFRSSSARSLIFLGKSPKGKELPKKIVFCYGVGHFLNDMTSACWFNYLLVFLVQVVGHSPTQAGLVLLSGQVADAISTPIIGHLSDRTNLPFGRRKTWLFGGAILVNLSFFFVFSSCYICQGGSASDWYGVAYYATLASTFNVGWASLQIAHMALVPEITDDDHERVRLNSSRYAGGISATLIVLGIAWISFQFYGVDSNAFHILSLTSIVIGDIFTLIFLFGIKECPLVRRGTLRNSSVNEPKLKPSGINDKAIHKKSRETPRGGDWKHWFRIPFFYQAGIIYMCTRITLNVSQVFMPFYLQESLNLKDSNGTVIAEVPLVMMVVSFVVSFFLKRANKHFGRRLVFVFGSLITGGGIATIYFTPQNLWEIVNAAAVLLGIGTTITLVTSITITADLVATSTHGAFVYGAFSFADKLANGIAIQFTAMYSNNAEAVRWIITLVPGSSTLLSILTIFTIARYYTFFKKTTSEEAIGERSPLLKETA